MGNPIGRVNAAGEVEEMHSESRITRSSGKRVTRQSLAVFYDESSPAERSISRIDSILLDSNKNAEGERSPMNKKYTIREHRFIIFVGLVLAFNSGFSNGVCLSGLLPPENVRWQRQSTSGFTGAYTNSALALANPDGNALEGFSQVEYFGYQIMMILSFMGGSCISALLNPRPAPWRLAPMYAPTFLIGAGFMCAAALLSTLETSSGTAYFYFFVAIANGIQNGISSMYTANLIRTTHLTGTSTDIGLFVGQALRGNTKNLWKLEILVALAVSFWSAGLVSFWAVQAWKRYTLLVSAGIFLAIFFLIVSFLANNLHINPLRAMEGTWHWQRILHDLDFRSMKDGSPKAKEELLQIFDEMDDDGNGFLTPDEFYEGLQAVGLENTLTKDQVHTLFEVCDRNGDGRISKREFLTLVEGDNPLVG